MAGFAIVRDKVTGQETVVDGVEPNAIGKLPAEIDGRKLKYWHRDRDIINLVLARRSPGK